MRWILLLYKCFVFARKPHAYTCGPIQYNSPSPRRRILFLPLEFKVRTNELVPRITTALINNWKWHIYLPGISSVYFCVWTSCYWVATWRRLTIWPYFTLMMYVPASSSRTHTAATVPWRTPRLTCVTAGWREWQRKSNGSVNWRATSSF